MMFKFLLRVTTNKGVSKWVKELSTPDTKIGSLTTIQTVFKFDKETETVYAEYEGHNGSGFQYWTVSATVNEIMQKTLKFHVNNSLKSIEHKVDTITGDKKLQLYVASITKDLRKIVKNYNTNKSVRERQVIKEAILRTIDGVQELLGDQFEIEVGSIKNDVGKVGNPNFRKREAEIDIHEVVRLANQYLKNEPEIYEPRREGSFLSSNLRDQLAEDFNVAPSTLREHMGKKCKKVERLFEVKNGY